MAAFLFAAQLGGCPQAIAPYCDVDDPACSPAAGTQVECPAQRPARYRIYQTGRYLLAADGSYLYEDFRLNAARGVALQPDQPYSWDGPVTLALIPDLGGRDDGRAPLKSFSCRIEVLFSPPPDAAERVALRITSDGICELTETRGAGEPPVGGWVLYGSGSWPASTARRGAATGTVGLAAGLDAQLVLAALGEDQQRAIFASGGVSDALPRLTLTSQNGPTLATGFPAVGTYRDVSPAGDAPQISVAGNVRDPQAANAIAELFDRLNRLGEPAGLPRLVQ